MAADFCLTPDGFRLLLTSKILSMLLNLSINVPESGQQDLMDLSVFQRCVFRSSTSMKLRDCTESTKTDVCLLKISPSLLRHPDSVLAALAHEACHHILDLSGQPVPAEKSPEGSWLVQGVNEPPLFVVDRDVVVDRIRDVDVSA